MAQYPDAMSYPMVAPALQEQLCCWSVRQRVTGGQRVPVQAQDHVDVGHARTLTNRLDTPAR